MCGITGFFSYKNKINTKNYYNAHKKIAHRGPDDEGFLYIEKNNIDYLKGDDTISAFSDREHILTKESSRLILGHRRLSIIDLTSNGHQPISFEHLHLVYNGEIYNYIELKEELKNKGYEFKTNSDTEVFLKAYHYWGIEAFDKFNGMWAAAIYDKKRDTILLTRDRFGIKPLYYSIKDNNLIFGSEIKFVSSFFDNLEANEQMVYEYLRFNYIDHTKETLFKDIMQLEPNSYMVFSKYGINISTYWKLKDKSNINKENIEDGLNSSIELRMRADVEVGSLLSGGIDSSLIVGLIDSYKHNMKLQTFSAVFKEEKFSEKEYIDAFDAKNIKLTKNFIYPNAKELVLTIEELIYTQEEPFRSLAVFSQYEIYKYIKQNSDVTVLLNGQGADEVFTGYTKYYYIFFLELLRRADFKQFIKEFEIFKKNRTLSSIKLAKLLLREFLSLYIQKKDKYRIFNREFLLNRNKKKFKNLLKNELWKSLTFSALREYLRYEDKNSMRFSLESRLPFLDFRLVEDGFNLNDEFKISNGLSKIVLRDIAKGKIPNQTLNRKDKMGFVSPQELWQREVLKDELDLVFKEIYKNGIFDFIDNKRIYDLYQKYQNKKFNDWAFIWRVYCLYKWKKVWGIQ